MFPLPTGGGAGSGQTTKQASGVTQHQDTVCPVTLNNLHQILLYTTDILLLWS